MSEQTTCVQCGRAIDASARICPFCNWDQTQPVPAVRPLPSIEVAEYRPPDDRDLRRKAIVAGAALLLLIASFVVGMVINSDGAPKQAPEPIDEQTRQTHPAAPRRADTPLIPAGAGGLTQPITSAPATATDGAIPEEYQRTDATAVSAVEYAQMEKRAKAAKARPPAFADPRSITGNAWSQAPPRPRRPDAAAEERVAADSPGPAVARERVAVRTRPVPQYQPVPSLRVDGTARLTLLVGADGKVKQVGIDRVLDGGNTPALLAAVQSWRFKPATVNGEAVAAPYSVEISFRRNQR